MVSGSESVPQNFEVISTTADSQKPALKNNNRIIYRRLPLVQTSAVVSDIAIYDQKSALPQRWQCIAVINNMQLVVKQIAKRDLEDNNKNETGGDSNNLNPQNKTNLQHSQFRSAKMRSQKSNYGVFPEDNNNLGVYSTAATNQSLPQSSYGSKMINSQTSVSKVGPIDGLEFSISKKVVCQDNNNSVGNIGAEQFLNHESKELVDFDFGKEMAILLD